MQVEIKGKVVDFTKASDGWFENKDEMLAINPTKTCCITDPWHADYLASAPKHDFKILEE